MQDFNKTKEIPFEYFTPQEANLFAFYVIPKELFINSKYKNISTDSKLLYGLLRDRNQLSVKNGWLDKAGHIFIYFSREEVCEILGISFEKAVKLFKELHGVGLIKEIRQGLNKPNIIYVGKILSESKENQRTSENPISGYQENRYQDIGKINIRISVFPMLIILILKRLMSIRMKLVSLSSVFQRRPINLTRNHRRRTD